MSSFFPANGTHFFTNQAPSQPQQQQQQQQEREASQEGGDSGGSSVSRSGSGSAGGGAYECPNCGKHFARDDLLRRHLSREARAAAQPSFDRQKSCQSCASSKARCDLEVPSCGRCRERGKTCIYGPRSGNPNVRRALRESMQPQPALEGQAAWIPQQPMHSVNAAWGNYNVNTAHVEGLGSSSSSLPQSHPHPHAHPHHAHAHHQPKRSKSNDDNSSSDDSHSWSDSFHNFRITRNYPVSDHSDTDNASVATDYVASGPASHGPPTYVSYDSVLGGPTQPVRSPNSSFHHAASPHGQTTPHAHGPIDIDTSVSRRSYEHEEGENTPIAANGPSMMHHHLEPHHAATAPVASVMRPPSTASSHARFRTTTVNSSSSSSNGGSEFWPAGPPGPHSLYGAPYASTSPTNSSAPTSNISAGGRPQPPRLLTGSKMPRPGGSAGPSSGRQLFSAQLDLSGWLEEPVVPSPLYRMGPTLASMGSAAATHSFLPPTPISEASSDATRQALSAPRDTVMRSNSDPGSSPHVNAELPAGSSETGDEKLSSRYWWANAGATANQAEMQSMVAQHCASHFTLYPALLSLPDPSSPVPPLFHRPWLARARLETPSTLAVARVVIAGYQTRLPSSEAMVWDLILHQTRTLVSSAEQIASSGTNLEVFAGTAAMWLYCILLLMAAEPSVGTCFEPTLVDRALLGLSTLAVALSQRVRRLEDVRRTSGSDFLAWGFEETCRRTLFASYALLVLQRFRETSSETQARLADADMVLDVMLPAGAAEFEAATDLVWSTTPARMSGEQPTLRALLLARSDVGNAPDSVLSYFDRHDDFTNVVLSVAFALDRRLD